MKVPNSTKESMNLMKQGYQRYVEAFKKRKKENEDTPEIIKEIQLAYKEAFEAHKIWYQPKDQPSESKAEGQVMHPDMIRDLSTFFADAIGGFPCKFKTPKEN